MSVPQELATRRTKSLPRTPELANRWATSIIPCLPSVGAWSPSLSKALARPSIGRKPEAATVWNARVFLVAMTDVYRAGRLAAISNPGGDAGGVILAGFPFSISVILRASVFSVFHHAARFSVLCSNTEARRAQRTTELVARIDEPQRARRRGCIERHSIVLECGSLMPLWIQALAG
jgi:hypothetical protein